MKFFVPFPIFIPYIPSKNPKLNPDDITNDANRWRMWLYYNMLSEAGC